MTNTPFTLKDQKYFKTVFLNTVENCILRAVKLRGTRPKMHSKSALKKFTQNNQCNDEQKHIFTWTSAFGRPGFDTDWSVTDTSLQEPPVQTSNKKINYFNEVKMRVTRTVSGTSEYGNFTKIWNISPQKESHLCLCG